MPTIFPDDSAAERVLTGLWQQLHEGDLDRLTKRSMWPLKGLDHLVLFAAILERLDRLVEQGSRAPRGRKRAARKVLRDAA